MNEFKIHQRFFDKLKQKAEKKKKDLEEQAKDKGKGKIQKDKAQTSPERPQRKRPIPPERQMVEQPEAVERLEAAAEPNGVSFKVDGSDLENKVPPSEESLAKKKIKVSNGVDADINSSESNRSQLIGNGVENCYDGGISLAHFLAETVQSQAAEEKPNSSQLEKEKYSSHALNASIEMEQEVMTKNHEEQKRALQEEREMRREANLAMKREEKEKPVENLHTSAHSKHGSEAKHHSKTHKDDHHNIQASISSMLHTVKDFFFGKGKKDPYDHTDGKEREFDHASMPPPQSETPPSFRLQPGHNPDTDKPLTEDVVPMETDKPKESSGSVDTEQQPMSWEMHEHKHDETVIHSHLPQAHKLPTENITESTGQCVKEAGDAVEAMEATVGKRSSSQVEEIPFPGLEVPTEVRTVGS